MKNALILAILFLSLGLIYCAEKPQQEENVKEEVILPNEPDSVLRHVVLFGFKPEITEAGIDSLNVAFGELQNSISEIKGFEWGLNNSPEGLSDGLTHCFTVTFHSEADRDTYLPHPAHQAFVEEHGPKIAKVVVVDYWTR